MPREIKPAEILYDEDGLRLVRLEFAYNGQYNGTNELLAELRAGLVTLKSARFDTKKVKHFCLSPTEMDTLAQAWQQFRQDQDVKEATKKVEYQAEIQTLIERAAAVGGTLVHYAEDERNYESFALTWPADHPIYGRKGDTTGLSKRDVIRRLDYAESQTKEIQSAAAPEEQPF